MKRENLRTLLGVLLFGFCIVLVIYGFWRIRQLEASHLLGNAITCDCTMGGLSNAGRIFIDYKIIINNKTYKASTVFFSKDLSYSDCTNFFIGKTFPAVYYPKNPSNSLLLIEPKQFKRFGYTFPDSLKWVFKYINYTE